MSFFVDGYKRTINGFEVNNVKNYADSKKYMVIKMIDGEWWFEAADDNAETVGNIVSALNRLGIRAAVIKNMKEQTA
ncbi:MULTISPECIES: hypothetical protein [unclassified Bilifractor]|uniref:hypothetical protein n=1 Tax=unclassified Bilifractor TaxID=2815795 RepID=UPI003F8DADE3